MIFSIVEHVNKFIIKIRCMGYILQGHPVIYKIHFLDGIVLDAMHSNNTHVVSTSFDTHEYSIQRNSVSIIHKGQNPNIIIKRDKNEV